MIPKAICVFGICYSGKSSLLDGIDEVFSVGEIIRSLEEGTSLKSIVENELLEIGYISDRTLEEILRKKLDPVQEFFIFDGTPRTEEQYHTLRKMVNIQGSIEVRLEEELWEKRTTYVNQSRPERLKKSYEDLKLRKKKDQLQISQMRSLFDRWEVVYNNGPLEDTRRELISIIGRYKIQ